MVIKSVLQDMVVFVLTGRFIQSHDSDMLTHFPGKRAKTKAAAKQTLCRFSSEFQGRTETFFRIISTPF